MAAVSQAEAEKVIQAAKRKLQDRKVVAEVGKLSKITAVLGYGSPSPDVIAVRFQCQFQKAGPTRIVKGKGESGGRGVLNGQVSAKSKNGKLIQLSVARDGGWGKTLEVGC